MTDFTPSPYQQDFFDWVRTGTGSCVLVAVAGSGKTTSVVKSLRHIPGNVRSVRLLAFNATVAKELQERIREEGLDERVFAASTFHSLGYGAVRKHLEARGVRPGNPDDKKCRGLARDLLGDKSPDLATYADFACKLVGLAKGEGIGPLTSDTEAAWADLAAHHDLQLDEEGATEERGIEIARQLLVHSNEAAERGSLDFNDMLYCVLLWNLRIWQNDWVYIDESQDTSPTRRALARKALLPGGRLVAVGDPRQSVYGFAGASHDAIELIKDAFRASELPLTVCYRCAKSIVAEAQRYVTHIEAFEGAEDGVVETLPMAAARQHLGPHDAVLCRQTAPLIKLAYELIGSGTGCRVLGRDIGAGLVALVKKAKAGGIDALVKKLETYRDREVARLTDKGEELKAEGVSDRVESVLTVVGCLPEGNRTVPALIEAIEGLFSDVNGCLTLCTAHRAKGKEWDTVAILRPELMPSRWARQDWQHQQEINLQYVATTRAKRHLIYIQTEKKEG